MDESVSARSQAGGHHSGAQQMRTKDTPAGFALITLYIVSDAYASTWQRSIFTRGCGLNAMMLWMNAGTG